MTNELEMLAELLKRAVLEELQAQEGGNNALMDKKQLDKDTKPSIACGGGKYDKTA